MIVERIDSTWLRGYVEDSPTVFGFFPANFVDEGGVRCLSLCHSPAAASSPKLLATAWATVFSNPVPADPSQGTGGAEEEEEDSVAHEKRTLWVGSIPESGASVSALTAVFAAFGPLDNITVRKKETAEHGPNKSWCFVSYKSADSARSAVVETIAMEDVQLRVREPNLAAEMSKPTTGALGAIWENHKSLLGAAMKVNLQQEGDGITAGMTMGKIEKALDLVPTGHKADKTDSADLKVVARNEGSFDTKKEAKIASASFRKIKQISIDFEATRSSDFEDKKGAMEG